MCLSVEESSLSRQDSLSSVKGESVSTYLEDIKRKLRNTLGMRLCSSYASVPEEATVRARFIVKGKEADWLLITMARFKTGVQKALEVARQGKANFTDYVKASMNVIGNNRYARGSAKIVQGIVESVKELQKLGENISLSDVELGDWWIIQSLGAKNDRSERGNRNIRLVGNDTLSILVHDGASWRRIETEYRASPRYAKILEEVAKLGLESRIGYLARVVLLEASPDKAYCELQITIPWMLYARFLPVKGNVKGENVCGVDANLDRVNLAIVSKQGILSDTFTVRFPEAKVQGLDRERRVSITMDAIHKLLCYAVNHGCSTIVLENPEILGYLRWVWIKRGLRKGSTWNRRVTLFTADIAERIAWHAPQYGLKVYYVNPAYTSKLAEIIAKDMGLDRHTTSAYVIALEYLGLNPKEIYTNLQRP